jgi:hypothetical protein
MMTHGEPSRDRFDGFLHGAAADEVFRVLRDSHRRFALYFLLEHDSVSLAELADVVTGWRRANSHGTATRADRDRVYTLLRHQHVPAMEAAGLVAYDEANDVVESGDDAESVGDLLRWAYDVEFRTAEANR